MLLECSRIWTSILASWARISAIIPNRGCTLLIGWVDHLPIAEHHVLYSIFVGLGVFYLAWLAVELVFVFSPTIDTWPK